MVKDEMNTREIPSYCMKKVNTAVAFDLWGIDIADLEKRREKIQELNL